MNGLGYNKIPAWTTGLNIPIKNNYIPMKKLFSFSLILLPFFIFSQKDFTAKAFEDYASYQEKSLNTRRFKHADIQPLIEALKKEPGFGIKKLGNSIEGRSISMISLGTGKTTVLLWSQMHGDEPTATMAIFDLLNYFKSNKTLLDKINLHFIPMLNPDGAEQFNRRNAIGIDINRDAVRLQSPESRILKAVRDSLKADFGFNLHDQSKYYNAENTDKPATISLLAPAYNEEKSINEVRANAMKIIVEIDRIVRQYAPGQTGRYDDEFEPRAFGDNIQKWGTSSILIESGGYQNDPEKQFIRKLNYVAILSALQSIAVESYKKIPVQDYEKIPKNDRKLFDLKITNLTFPYLNKNYTVDLGIVHNERANNKQTEFYYLGQLTEIGDLSNFYGYETLDAQGLQYKTGQTHPKIIKNTSELEKIDFTEFYQNGYTSVGMDSIPGNYKYSLFPINIVDVSKMEISKINSKPKNPLVLGRNPSFLLFKDDKVKYAVINGFVYDVANKKNMIKNSIVE